MTLLAKPEESLVKHTKTALKVFKSLMRAYHKVPNICGVDNFWENLFYSVFFHDIGKAASGFQKMLINNSSWNYRHEILSASFVDLINCPSTYKNAIGLSIVTHHKDVLKLRERYATSNPIGEERFLKKLKELNENFNEISEFISNIPYFSNKYLGDKLENFEIPSSIDHLVDPYKKYVLSYFNDFNDNKKTILHEKYGLFLKGFLTACDHLASASKQNILGAVKNMSNVYHFPEFRKIQLDAMKTDGNAILQSPTGSGKTEAALFWSDRNQSKNKMKRVYYVLPYTASINAMFRRLSRDFKDKRLVGVQHGRAGYFLYKTLSQEDTYENVVRRVRAIRDLTKKIYRPYKILTPFQILKVFFGTRGFEQSLSEMTDSLFILDEIHTYDAHTTSLILLIFKILKEGYNANILIMSATIPRFIKELFEYELEIENEISSSSEELKKFTRHKVEILDEDIFENIENIKNDLRNGKKILVVCNTVSQAQKVYKKLYKSIRRSGLIHGKFILRDRENIEKRLKNLNLLVGTQAIEVSLNINYDVLYTEPAPIDALIQRFGRVNRRGWENNRLCPVYVFKKGSEKDKYVYKNDKVIKKTIELLNQVDLLEEQKIQELVDEVYGGGYQGQDKEDFERVKRVFPKSYEKVVPFIHEKQAEEEFYSLFKSVEVVPIQYKLDFLKEIENQRYFEALKFFTSISMGQFKKLEVDDCIDRDNNTIFVSVKYNPELGLILNEQDDNIL